MLRFRLCAAVSALALAGTPLPGEEVRLSAAASLTDVLEEIVPEFERASRHHVVLNLAASSTLARQILAGAPTDVFFSADSAQMDVVVRAGLVDPVRRITVLGNALVVVVPADSPVTLASARDLARLRRLAMADPVAAPAGVYARRWLESLGLWDSVADRVVPALDVRAALAAVESEAAEAGIVYRTDAAISRRVRIALGVAREQAPEITFVLAPLRGARSPATAALVSALTSASAASVYERRGFSVLFAR